MKNYHRIKWFVLFTVSIILFSFLQNDNPVLTIAKIKDALDSYNDSLKFCKIYIHTDKKTYYTGESIWMKGYLINSVGSRPDTAVNQIYVELINPHKNVVRIIRMKISDRDSYGDFFISDTLPEGIYTIRAYTRWLMNFGPEYYFTEHIRIVNPLTTYLLTPLQAKTNRKLWDDFSKLKKERYIDFFPEGGHMLSGIKCKIAYKATDGTGKGVSATGVIKDKKKNVIAELSTQFKGMGFFYLTPEADERYSVEIEFDDGTKKKIALPQSVTNSVTTCITADNDLIKLEVLSNKEISDDRPANEMIIIGMVHGTIYYASFVNLLDNNTSVLIPKRTFPSGVIHFSVFNNRLLIISERLFFNLSDLHSPFEIVKNTQADSIQFLLKKIDPFPNNNKVNLSIVVRLDNELNLPCERNLLTELLLSSEFSGYIEDPYYYFDNKQPSVKEHADLLVLTHGWKNHYWDQIISKRYPKIRYEPETAVAVKGKIVQPIGSFAIKNADVSLAIMNKYNDEFYTSSDKKGNFSFTNLNYTDTVDAKIVAEKSDHSKNLLIVLDDPQSDNDIANPYDFFITTNSCMDRKEYRRKQSEIARIRMNQRERELDSIYSKSIHGRPDYVIWGDEIPSGCSNILEAMNGKVPGMIQNGNSVVIRGVSTIMGSSDPLLLIDNVPASIDNLTNISPTTVERIEILTGPSCSMYGSSGGNGVIAIYTKQGSYMKKGEISFSFLGYHIAQQYKSPAPDNIDAKMQKDFLPITLYWNPHFDTNKVASVGIHGPSDKKVKIIVIIEGFDAEGNPVCIYGSY